MNIKLNYLYRDAGNYKTYGFVTFSNPDCLPLAEVEQTIKAKLIDGEFFDPRGWRVPALQSDDWDGDLDHEWNEFQSVELTSEDPTINFTIGQFLQMIQSAAA